MWQIEYLPEVKKDFDALDKSQREPVLKMIRRVAQNPLPANEGGYGKPLGNKQGIALAGLLKIKLRSLGIRVVYKVIRENDVMKIVIVGARADDEVYTEAEKRARKYDL